MRAFHWNTYICVKISVSHKIIVTSHGPRPKSARPMGLVKMDVAIMDLAKTLETVF